MTGVVLAGGKGTRLYPATLYVNKHLLPIHDRPMIFYPLETLQKAGITRVVIICDKDQLEQFKLVIRDGAAFGFKQVYYAAQERAGGMAEALLSAERFVINDSVFCVAGDMIIEDALTGAVKRFEDGGGQGAVLFLKPYNGDLTRHGIAQVIDGKMVAIEEKSKKPKSNLVVMALYIYDRKVFNHIQLLKPSWRGQFECTDLNNIYIREGGVTHQILEGFAEDAGEPHSLSRCVEYAARNPSR